MDGKAVRLTGYALTGAFTLFMLFDVAIKLIRHPMVEQSMRQLGFTDGGLGFSIGVIEAVCLVLYLIPRTAVLGALFQTAYLGGAFCANLRIDAPLFSSMLFPVYIGILVWAGLYLRNAALRTALGVDILAKRR